MAYSSIVKPTDYFNTITYSGNGSNPRTLTGVGFQPDWVWLKNRTDSNGHTLADAVRGANETLSSDGTGAEVTDKSDGHLDAFTSDGFTVGAGSSSDARVNDGSHTYVAWNWLGANGTASNSDGSITSTVSANTTAGFSIIDFTGNETNSSVGHGLGVAPSMFIMRRYTDDGYSSTTEWYTYHKSLASDKYLRLQSTALVATNDGSLWNTSTPVTSSVINIGFNAHSNHTGNKTIIYAFAEKKGYSKFGSYEGTGNANGTFVYTGFKPAWVLTKRTDDAADWFIRDNKQDPENVMNEYLSPNTSATSGNLDSFDFVSNGFKIRNSNNAWNGSGNSYIYMAFAENSFVANDSGTAVPVVAR